MKLLKDLLYGGRNEYLDIVRVLALLGGIVFLVLVVCEFAGLGQFDEVSFAGAWAGVLTASTGVVYARNRSDRLQREHAAALQADLEDRRPLIDGVEL